MNIDLLELQTQISYQEDTVQQLNDVVTRQQADIDLLQREVDLLRGKLMELIASVREAGLEDAPPPHY